MTTSTGVRPFREPDGKGGYIINWSVPQIAFADSDYPINIFQAGRQSGKTSSEVEILALEMERCGPGDYLFAAPTFPLMEPRIIPELRECFVHYRGFDYRPGYHRIESKSRMPNGEPEYRILLGSAVNPESLASSTVKGAIIDELAQSSFPWAAWYEIERAVAVNEGRIYAGTTLYDVSGSYKLEIYDRWVNGDPRINIIEADSLSNPAFPVAEWEHFRETMPPWKFDMMYRGKYTRPMGLVYDCFDESTQVIDRIPPEKMKDWPRYWGHDFGPSNTAAVVLAQDPSTGLMYVERTYHRGELSVGQHAEEFKNLSRNTNVRLRAGGAWAEEEARYAYLASGWPIIRPGIRDVEAGIDQVYSWMAKGQIFVFRDLTEFLNELLTYSRELTDTFQVTDRIRDKSRYHLMDCFVAGTMIQTTDGEKPIESIKAGDLVATRQGYHPVITGEMTKYQVEVCEVAFSNGATLKGTPDHPVWVQGKGFVPLDTLRYGDIMETWKVNELSSKVSPTTVTPMPSDALIECTSTGRASAFMSQCGKILTAPFQRGMSFITRTMTLWITAWKTLNCCLHRSTCGITTSLGNMTWNIWPGYGLFLPLGMAVRKEWSGTEQTARQSGETVSQPHTSANGAGNSTRPRNGEMVSGSALINAGQQLGVKLAWMTKLVPVQFAGRTSLPTDIPEVRPAPDSVVRVLSVKRAGKANVYNLHVSEVPEYYANGILVHNCLRYILSTLPVERTVGQRKPMLKTYEQRDRRNRRRLVRR